jgi:phosphate acetyltransferase
MNYLRESGVNFLERTRQRARSLHRSVVFPEGTEERTIQAASQVAQLGIARPTLVGTETQIGDIAEKIGVGLRNVECIDPQKSPHFDKFIHEFYQLRQKKGISIDEARQTISNPLYFGAMMVRNGQADGSVAGAQNTTGNVVRAAIQVIGLASGITTLSGAFIMVVPDFLDTGQEKTFVFADSAVLPAPNERQLVSVVISSAKTMERVVGEEPIVAMLSFSTKGSARHPSINKMLAAMEMAKEMAPDLKIEGELQVDAAVVPEIGKRKVPHSPYAGKANVLIFPDLNAGNIAYKLVQRMAKAQAIGPVLQGLAKPANDLSRGCSVQDIIDVTAITMVTA